MKEDEIIFIKFSKSINSEQLKKTMNNILKADELNLMTFITFETKEHVKTIVVDFEFGGNLILDLYPYGLFIMPLKNSSANSIKKIENFLKKILDSNIKTYTDEEKILEILDKKEE